MHKVFIILLVLFVSTFSKAHAQIGVQHYHYQLALSDASDTLKGTATIRLKFLKDTKTFRLDLASVKDGKGMQVLGISSGNQTFSNTHANDTLWIRSEKLFIKDSVQTFSISYAGIPADGLIISTNKWGERTFFADNWPDRAHQWLPCNDRPDDKATVDFSVVAPSHYKIISNGILVEEKYAGNNQRFTHWKETIPIPTKVMVIGAARFAVKNYSDSAIAPVSAWVYPQDSVKGFYDYELASSVVKFFSDYIGPYPFEKLANVQSKTIFGGMENAGAIFYGENTVTGDRSSEALLAHEIAHQWFGNSATEKTFAHLWLSEGFATYMTHLYLEQKYGRDTLLKRLQDDRNEIIKYSKQWNKPVVDSLSNFMDLLNVNSYQKGSWVLHMLRGQVGDTVFKNIMQTYYNRYKYSNAYTWAFEKVAEEVSRKDLTGFFQQWLYTPGIPQLNVRWRWRNGQLFITIRQMQKQVAAFPLTIGVYAETKKLMRHQVNITQITETFALPATKKPVQVVLDPGTGLLFEEVNKLN